MNDKFRGAEALSLKRQDLKNLAIVSGCDSQKLVTQQEKMWNTCVPN